MNFKFLNAALLVLLLGLTANADEFDIYILAGQSNADGRGDAAELDPSVVPGLTADIWYYTTDASLRSNGWVDLAPGFSAPPPNYSGNVNFGPEISFAGAVKTASGTGNEVGIIKVTEGGTGISTSQEWSPDASNPGVLYTALFQQVDSALQALESRGDTGVIRGVIWHQGESNRSLATYTDVLSVLISDVRTAYGANLPFVVGELSRERADNTSFNDQLAAFVNDTSNTNLGLVSSVGFTTVNGVDGDDTHFDAASQILMGQRFADAIAPLLTAVPIVEIAIDLTTDTTNGTGTLLDSMSATDRLLSSINTTPLTVDAVESVPNNGGGIGTVVPGLTFSIIAGSSLDPDAEFNASGGAFGVDSVTPVDGIENPSRFDSTSSESLTIAFNQDVNVVSIQLAAFGTGETFTVGGVTFNDEDSATNPDDIYSFAPGTAFFAAGEGILLTSTSGQVGIEGITIAVVEADVLLGDVNLDGVVNFLDISPFISVLSGGGFQLEADIDENGIVNFLDISPFIGILSGS